MNTYEVPGPDWLPLSGNTLMLLLSLIVTNLKNNNTFYRQKNGTDASTLHCLEVTSQ